MSPKEIKELKKTIREQDRMIGELTRKVNYLEDSQSKRSEWLRKAKQEAGYPDSISFDVVWGRALELIKNQKK